MNPGDPTVLDRMMRECCAGAPLGYVVTLGTDGHFVVYEPTEHLPWIILIASEKVEEWRQRFPHMQQMWILAGTAEQIAQRMRDAGIGAKTVKEMEGAQ